MIRSMTGFGRATGELDGEVISLEVTAVNHRFLDCSFRLTNSWSALETVLREVVKSRISRGKLNIYVGRKRGNATRQEVHLDVAVAQQYLDASRQLADLMSTTQALSLDVLAGLEGVFYQDEKEDDLDRVREALERLLIEALDQLNAMRTAEGEALEADVQARIALMRQSLAAIEAELPTLSQQYEERLRNRIRDLGAESGLSEDRLAAELAFLAEKSDVSEEVVRLKAHFDHVLSHLAADTPVGRELNFLAQEIQREVNTLGSKMREESVTREILRMKSELEKLREQVQNVE
ncbi:MAG: YicC family protein [Candidatus Hydrogenedentes bacterium]|nr:YicC family protein [Candidatus Hydrogenedentota bacterium]